MHILLTNDDGPPNGNLSPYIKPLAHAILKQTDWELSICVPYSQKSWIGKAHHIGEDITATYMYTKDACEDLGPFDEPQPDLLKDRLEWTMLTGTPATCANIGSQFLYPHKGSVDLVISGPNFGRNTSAAYSLGSGTVGAALEAAICGKRSIALSFSYRMQKHPEAQVDTACRISINIVRYLVENWDDDCKLYSVNIPLSEDLDDDTPIRYAPMLENCWSKVFSRAGPNKFAWCPDYEACDATAYAAGPGSDAWTVLHNEISVTPLRASFKGVDKFNGMSINLKKPYFAVIETPDLYVENAWRRAFDKEGVPIVNDAASVKRVFRYKDYDQIDFDARDSPSSNLEYSYVYRKGLIRKNYLARTVAHYCAKHPKSILNQAFPESYLLEVDYAEFLDDALDEAYDLRYQIETSGKAWIVKPAMSDRAQGIRIFKTLDGLKSIFEDFETPIDSEDETTIMHLRHFVVQEYLNNPLLIDNRKFHLRVYVLTVGNIRVYVYTDMLALFASKPYRRIDSDAPDLQCHLTNTCIQQSASDSVRILEALNVADDTKASIVDNVCEILRDLFAAAIADPINFWPASNALEFFGVDFLVLDDLSVKLLEVNAYPDFKQTGEALQGVVDGFFEATIATAITPFFTKTKCKDNKLRLVLDQS